MEYTVDIDTSVPSSSSSPRSWALRRPIVPAIPSVETFGVEGVEIFSPSSSSPTPRPWALRRNIVPAIPSVETFDVERVETQAPWTPQMPEATSATVAIDLKLLREEMSANVRLVEALGISVEQMRTEIRDLFVEQNAKGGSDNCSMLSHLIQKVSHMETSILEEMRTSQIKHSLAAGGGKRNAKMTEVDLDSDHTKLDGIKSAIEDIREQLISPNKTRSRMSSSSARFVKSEAHAGEIGRWVLDGHSCEIDFGGVSLKLKLVKDGTSSETVLTRSADGFLVGVVNDQHVRLKHLYVSNELVINYFLNQEEVWGEDIFASKAVVHDIGNCLGLEAQRRKMKQHTSMMMQWRERAKLMNFINQKRQQYGDVFGSTNTSDSWWMEFLEDVQHSQADHATSVQEPTVHGKEARRQHKLTFFYRCCIRRTSWEKTVESRFFLCCSVLFILSNAIWIAVASNHSMKRMSNQHLPMREDWFDHVDGIFTCIFLVELIIRLAAYRIKFFFNDDWVFNWFDFVIVSINLIGFFSKDVGVNANVLRVIRLLRVLRMIRAIRSVTFFAELQHYMVTLLASIKVWLWAMFFFSFCTFCTTLTVMEFFQSLGDHDDPQTLRLIRMHFGDLRQAMFTIAYAATNGVLWGSLVEEYGQVVGSVQVAITVYVLMMIFMLFPIILAEYTLKVFHIRDADTNVLMQSRMEQADLFLNDFSVRCRRAGYKLNKQLDVEQLDRFMKHEDIESILISNEIFLVAEEVFPIFDNDGKITVKEFMYGCQWLKTANKPTDSLFLSEQIQKLAEDIGHQKDRTAQIDRVLAEFRAEFRLKWDGEVSDANDN